MCVSAGVCWGREPTGRDSHAALGGGWTGGHAGMGGPRWVGGFCWAPLCRIGSCLGCPDPQHAGVTQGGRGPRMHTRVQRAHPCGRAHARPWRGWEVVPCLGRAAQGTATAGKKGMSCPKMPPCARASRDGPHPVAHRGQRGSLGVPMALRGRRKRGARSVPGPVSAHASPGQGVLPRGGGRRPDAWGSLCLLEQMGARSPASPSHWRTVPARQPSGSRVPRAPAPASPAATATAGPSK